MKIDSSIDSYMLFPSARLFKLAKILAPLIMSVAIIIGWNYYDVMWWIQWCRIVEEHGFIGLLKLYELCSLPECKVPYPPMTILLFIPLYIAISHLHIILRVIILKVSLVVLPGLAIYKIIKKIRGNDVALLWFLCIPFLQIVFALQFDVILALLVLLSTYMLTRHRIDASALCLALASLIKYVVVILVPLYIIFLWKTRNTKHIIRYIAIYTITIICIVAPFFIISPKGFIANIINFHSSRIPQDLSLWSIPTILLENNIIIVKDILSSLWIIPFSICYTMILILFYNQVRNYSKICLDKLLPLYTSIILLLYITLNKIGNLNYLVWFVPVSLIAMYRKHIKIITMLTTIVGIVGASLYAIMIYIPPASVNAPMFIAEDLIYWNPRALMAQSFNYYLFYIASYLHPLTRYTVDSAFTSTTDFVSELWLFKYLYYHKTQIIILSIVASQLVLTTIIILKIRWIKDYI